MVVQSIRRHLCQCENCEYARKRSVVRLMNWIFVHLKEQTLFEKVEDIFEQKVPQSDILDVDGLRPEYVLAFDRCRWMSFLSRFQYWWHGSLANGTASMNTCKHAYPIPSPSTLSLGLDWSRHDSNLSGIVSRILDVQNGLFYSQLLWPCSVDANSGILCIETNCNRNNYDKH